MKLGRKLLRAWRVLKAKAGMPSFLCDNCQFDYKDACKRPERPNAIDCPDYKRRK